MANILIAEDQHIVRQGLKMMIEQDENLRVVAEASNGEEVLHMYQHHPVDLVLMDIRMPIMTGLEATQRLKEIDPNAKILVLTTFNDDDYALQALKVGACGYLLKDADPQRLIDAIHSALKGGMILHDNVAAKVVPRLLEENTTVDNDSTKSDFTGASENKMHETLTPREVAIMRLVAEGKTNQEISSELYLSVGTVKNHISHILNKLELRDRTQLAIYALRHELDGQ